MSTDVSLLGTGLLGSSIARRLLETGATVTVWNRTRERTIPLEAEGAVVAGSAAGAVGDSPATLLLLTDAASIREGLLAPGTLPALAGRVVVQCGTIDPAESRALAADVRAAGGAWVEAPVLGSLPQAAAGTLSIMAGGEAVDVARVTPLLSRIGTVLHVGPVGSAASLKLALNQLIASMTAAFGTSLAFVRAEGIDVELFMNVLRPSALYAPTFDKKLGKMLSGDYGNPNFPLEHMLKDVDLFVRAAERDGVGTAIPRAAAEVVRRALGLGLSGLDYSALARGVEPARRDGPPIVSDPRPLGPPVHLNDGMGAPVGVQSVRKRSLDMKAVTAADVMTRHVVTLRDDRTVEEAAAFLVAHEISGAPVADRNGNLVGVLSVTDIVRDGTENEAGPSPEPARQAHGWERLMNPEEIKQLRVQHVGRLVSDIMTPTVFTVSEELSVGEVARTMVAGRIHRLIVTHGARPVGIVTPHDLLKLLYED